MKIFLMIKKFNFSDYNENSQFLIEQIKKS